VVLIDKFTLLSEECSDAPESRRNKEFINRKKRKEKKNEEEEYTRLHSYALRMFFLLAWLRHHIILHTLYWIYAPSPLEAEDETSQHIFATLP
jgi:hypothetical protein